MNNDSDIDMPESSEIHCEPVSHIPDAFKRDLEHIINLHCVENVLDMPDYLLAESICGYIENLALATRARDKWFGFRPFDRDVDGVVDELDQTIEEALIKLGFGIDFGETNNE